LFEGGAKLSIYTDFHTNKELNKYKMYFKYRANSQKPKWFLHSHDGIEIYFFMGGEANYIIGDDVYHLQPGDLLVFNGNNIHRVNPSNDVPYIRSYLNFVPSYLESFMSKDLIENILSTIEGSTSHLLRFNQLEIEEIEQIFKKMDEEKQKEHVGYKAMIQSYFTELLILIVRRIKNIGEDSITPNSTRKEMHVHQILNFINNHFNRELSLDTISDELFLNKYYMSHCFKEVTGFSINKYLSKIRIDKAKNMLSKTDESVTYIAEVVGLKSTVQLSRLFKQFEGISPNQFRKNAKSNKNPWGN
jgi:AraC-like DNA-binding protein